MRSVFAVLCCAALALAAHAAEPSKDAELDQRVLDVSHELRCLVCQNQTIADSNAPLAVDLRAQVREKLEEGRSREEIIGYMVERYGEFVRYRPAMNAKTLLLWFGPVLALIVAAVLLVRRLRLRSRAVVPTPLTDEERARAAAWLGRADDAK